MFVDLGLVGVEAGAFQVQGRMLRCPIIWVGTWPYPENLESSLLGPLTRE
jgi:hypothetical protein